MSKLDDITTALYNKQEIPVNANQQIRDLMLEIIGDDIAIPAGKLDQHIWRRTAKNELKAEMRQKVSEL